MCIKLLKLILSIFIASSIWSADKVSYAEQGDVHPGESKWLAEGIGCKKVQCLRNLAEATIDMLIATRGVIAKNQELINRDPISGNYYFKGFAPAVVGSQVANDFSLITGHNLKQTSLKLRNPSNAPDEWEKEVLKKLELAGDSKDDKEILGERYVGSMPGMSWCKREFVGNKAVFSEEIS